MSQPATPSSFEGSELPFPRPPTSRSNSDHGKITIGYKLFPTLAQPTPPASPPTLKQQSFAKARGSHRSRSLDSTVRLAAGQQNAVIKSVPVKRGRKYSAEEVEKFKSKHMSTVQEVPSPAISIPYSFLPRASEDGGHMRSSSAPGEFVRDSQVLPTPRIDLSKPQWTSKQADNHPAARGLGLSIPASMSVDQLDQKQRPPSSRSRPNLKIEIKNDARMKPKAIGVRGNDADDTPPPPPPKSPRHDSKNHSLSNITYDPRKVRRTHSKNISQTSSRSHSSPKSAHPSEEPTIATQGSFVKASVVTTPSPSNSAHPKPMMSVPKHDESSPLSGDIRIKELMVMSGKDAEDDLERPVPPPITPGRPRTASIGRMVSGPKSVSTEKSWTETQAAKAGEKASSSPMQPKSGMSMTPSDHQTKNTEQSPVASHRDANKSIPQSSRPEISRTNSPAPSSTTSKASRSKNQKPNLDKPMPAIPPPSSRRSEWLREVRGIGADEKYVPPVPSTADVDSSSSRKRTNAEFPAPQTTADKSANGTESQARESGQTTKQPDHRNGDDTKKQEPAATLTEDAKRKEFSIRGSDKAPKGSGLSAFPSVPAPPRIITGSPRAQSPASGRQTPDERPPPLNVRQTASRTRSPAPIFRPDHPAYQRVYSANPASNENAFDGPGPPRSRFYGRLPESANASTVTLVEQKKPPEVRGPGPLRLNTAPANPAPLQQSPAILSRSPYASAQTPPTEQRSTRPLETTAKGERHTEQRPRNESEGRPSPAIARPGHLRTGSQAQNQTGMQRAPSPATFDRAISPVPSARPASPADLLNKTAAAKNLPTVPWATAPRSATPDAASMLSSDVKPAIPDPAETLKFLMKQSEALHARHASLRAERLKLSTGISASLRESKPGPEYANLLLDQHLSLNAINSSLDICFAKLKTLDYKKEEAMQAVIEQMRASGTRHRSVSRSGSVHRSGSMKRSNSVSTPSTKASVSSKAATPEMGSGYLPPLQEREVQEGGAVATSHGVLGPAVHRKQGSGVLKDEVKSAAAVAVNVPDGDHASYTDGLPTPRPTPPVKHANSPIEQKQDGSSNETSTEKKRTTMVKFPSVSPAPSLSTSSSTGQAVGMSPVSSIDDNDVPKHITVEGVKAAKILGLVSSPPGVTLASPSSPMTVELKIHRKPLPGKPPPRKMTNESSSSWVTESEVGTPGGDEYDEEKDLVPKSLVIGRKKEDKPAVRVVSQGQEGDEDILDYYSR